MGPVQGQRRLRSRPPNDLLDALPVEGEDSALRSDPDRRCCFRLRTEAQGYA